MGLRNITAGLRNIAHKQRAEQELDDELRAYIDRLVEEKMRAGQEREQAMREARLEVGSMDALKQRLRDTG